MNNLYTNSLFSTQQTPKGSTIKDFTSLRTRDPGSYTYYFMRNILAMPEYRNTSIEEMRSEDYQLNRKPLITKTHSSACLNWPPLKPQETFSFGQSNPFSSFSSSRPQSSLNAYNSFMQDKPKDSLFGEQSNPFSLNQQNQNANQSNSLFGVSSRPGSSFLEQSQSAQPSASLLSQNPVQSGGFGMAGAQPSFSAFNNQQSSQQSLFQPKETHKQFANAGLFGQANTQANAMNPSNTLGNFGTMSTTSTVNPFGTQNTQNTHSTANPLQTQSQPFPSSLFSGQNTLSQQESTNKQSLYGTQSTTNNLFGPSAQNKSTLGLSSTSNPFGTQGNTNSSYSNLLFGQQNLSTSQIPQSTNLPQNSFLNSTALNQPSLFNSTQQFMQNQGNAGTQQSLQSLQNYQQPLSATSNQQLLGMNMSSIQPQFAPQTTAFPQQNYAFSQGQSLPYTNQPSQFSYPSFSSQSVYANQNRTQQPPESNNDDPFQTSRITFMKQEKSERPFTKLMPAIKNTENISEPQLPKLKINRNAPKIKHEKMYIETVPRIEDIKDNIVNDFEIRFKDITIKFLEPLTLQDILSVDLRLDFDLHPPCVSLKSDKNGLANKNAIVFVYNVYPVDLHTGYIPSKLDIFLFEKILSTLHDHIFQMYSIYGGLYVYEVKSLFCKK